MLFNRYPWWKNVMVVVVVFIGFLFALPNLYGEDPSIQVSGASATTEVDNTTQDTVKQALQAAQLPVKSMQLDNRSLNVRFLTADAQNTAKDIIQQKLGNDYLVALNMTPAMPDWLKSIGAMPMKLGLDLRGGVHLLLQVDVDSVMKQRIDGDVRNISQFLRDSHIRYTGLTRDSQNNIVMTFRAQEPLDEAFHELSLRFTEFVWTKNASNGNFTLSGTLDPAAIQRAHQDTLDQAMNTLRNRVNELGVSEALVQQQGASRVAVDLPGIQNATEAKNILGKTATLEFHMVDTDHDATSAVGGVAPADTHMYDYDGRPILLKNDIILRGSSIITATSGMGEDGRASVDVRLGGGGEELFTKTTTENVGKPMAVLYVEVKPEPKIDEKGNKTIEYHTDKRVISVATIRSALGNSFQISGLTSQEEARTLALLLRAGALPAPVAIIEEREVGPSLGKQNIHMGVMSVAVGFVLVVLFMAIYYSLFGLIADIALAMNLVLIVALLSLLGATLTLPGIAAMVLTLGMAVDANVLIFERIREELRNGMGVQASIHAGYERAFATIVDANVTTLIVAIVLFSLGSGAVKGFAVTLTIGLITSMFTAITGTRAIVNLIYGGKPVKKVAIGM